MDIAVGLASIKAGKGIITSLRNLEANYDQAALEIKIIDLTDVLINFRSTLMTAQQTEYVLLEKIKKLENTISTQINMKEFDHYFLDANDKTHKPLCKVCWQKDGMKITLQDHAGQEIPGEKLPNCFRCQVCGNTYVH